MCVCYLHSDLWTEEPAANSVPYMMTHRMSWCYGLNCVPPQIHVEVLTPSTTLECDHLEKGPLKEVVTLK